MERRITAALICLMVSGLMAGTGAAVHAQNGRTVGNTEPVESSTREEPGWTAFAPEPDQFTDRALVDLRDRNHAACGEKGRLMVRNGDFVWAAAPAERVRFWGVVRNRDAILADNATQQEYVRRMAKMGVNMIRLHGSFHGGVAGDPLAISDAYVERFDHFVATCRAHGVYFMINTWYDHWLGGGLAAESYGREGSPNGWQFIHPDGQALWKRWTSRLLDRVNPYTNLRNSKDPTIAILQLSNEDNYFFHNFQPYKVIPAETMVHLEARYARWLRAKYGSLDKARGAWGNQSHDRDEPAAGRLGLLTVHQLTGTGQRGKDQAAFMVHDYREVTDGFIAHLREMGYDGVVNNGNWISADPRVLEPLDKLANMNGKALSRHGVVWGAVEQFFHGYHYKAGDRFSSRSALHEPWKLPLTELHYDDCATMICEPKSTSPNRFRAEWLPLAACWGALQGLDAQVHFAGGPDWRETTRRWAIDEPTMMGQSPALSLIYREGYIAQAPVVVEERVYRGALLNLKGTAFHPISSLSTGELQPRDLALVQLEDGEGAGINPLVLMTGSLHRIIVDKPEAAGLRIDPRVEKCVDTEKRTLRSVTGELEINWKVGLLRIQAPKAQGAVGFLAAAGEVELPDVVIDCDNEYASVLCVPLDGKPLTDSGRILLTVVTEDRNYGWKTKPATITPKRGPQVEGDEITDVGRSPIQHLQHKGTIRFRRPDAGELTVTAVDWSGYPVTEAGRADRFELRGDVINYVIRSANEGK